MDYYQLTVNYEELNLDVRVNDMPVELSGEQGGTGVRVINDLLTGADNTITVTPKPSRGAAHAQAGASMHVNIMSFGGPGGGGGAGKVLYNYEWKLKDPHAPLPHVRGQFQATAPAEPLSWQSADKVQLTAADKAGIVAQIRLLHQALETKNVEETTALLSSEIHDQAVGFGKPLDGLQAAQRQFYGEQFAASTWRLSPIDEGALEYTLCGGGRVVLVHSRDGRKVFTSAPDKDGVSTLFDPYLSHIGGHWIIVK